MTSRNSSNNRSHSYQHIFCEIPCPPEDFEHYIDDATLLNTQLQSEQLDDLRQQLMIEYWRLITEILTPNDLQIIKYLADGYSQSEVGIITKTNQSKVHFCIYGGSNKGKKTGGCKLKLQKAAKEDPVIIELKRRIADLCEEMIA